MFNKPQLKNSLYVIGISYKKTSAQIRGKFNLSFEASNKLIKDARTGHERTDVQNVLDGQINDYIKAFLMSYQGDS